MKKILVCFLLTSPLLSVAQNVDLPIDSETKKITYTDVIENPGTKAQLYDKALQWFALSFNSANDAIQIKDKDAGKIMGKWTIQPSSSELGLVSVNISIFTKDGRYKYLISDIVYLGTRAYNGWAFEDDPTIWQSNMAKYAMRNIRTKTNSEILASIVDLKTYMAKKTVEEDF